MNQGATELFARIVEYPESEWLSMMDRLCGTNQELRGAVFSLLVAGLQVPEGFLEDGRPITAPFEMPLEGSRIGAYEILKPLGVGGMGAVYLARRADGAFEKQVALKLLSPRLVQIDFEQFSERMRTETAIQAKLSHRNVASVHDGGTTEEGLPYVVMEYVDGPSITEFCDREMLSIKERISLFRCVCDAVEYAHAELVLHLDLKPANILVDSRGDPRVIDFGVAELLGRVTKAASAHSEKPKALPLTPLYTSPEQLGGTPPGTASDAYALGLVLFELLTGAVPFSETASIEELYLRKTAPGPPRPSASFRRQQGQGQSGEADPGLEAAHRRRTTRARLHRRLLGALDDVIVQAIRPKPQQRLTVARLNDELGRYLSFRPSLIRPTSRFDRARKLVRRHPSLSIAFFLAVGLLLTVSMWFARELQRTRQELGRSESVAEFLGDVFLQVDPSNQNGGRVTGLEMIQTAITRLESDLRDTPEVRSLILWRLASTLHQYGDMEGAGPLLVEALEGITASFGRDSLERARVLNDLAINAGDRGLTAEERDYLEQSLRIKLLQRDHTEKSEEDLCNAYNNLGVNAYQRGDVRKAAERFEQSLAIAEGASDDFAWVDGKRVSLTGNLGAIHIALGNKERAQELLEKALTRSREHFGEVHQMTARVYANLGELAARRGRLEEAQKAYRESLAIWLELFQSPHQSIQVTRADLAVVLSNLGKPSEAAPLQDRVLDARVALYGPESAPVADALVNRGILERVRGKLAASKASLERALEIYPDEGDPSPEAVRRARAELAISLVAGNAFEEASLRYETIESACSDSGLVRSWMQVLCRTIESALMQQDGDVARAERLVEGTLEVAREAEWGIEMGSAWLVGFLGQLGDRSRTPTPAAAGVGAR